MKVIEFGLFGFFVLIASASSVSGQAATWNTSTMTQLRMDLLKFSNPYVNSDLDTLGAVVNVTMNVLNIDVDYPKSVITISSWLHLEWIDQMLIWDPNLYEGITRVTLVNDEVWKPNLIIFNSKDQNILDTSTSSYTVNNEGLLSWSPMSTFQVFCDIDLTNWPFDKQMCPVRLGSIVYSNKFGLNWKETEMANSAEYVEYGWRLLEALKQPSRFTDFGDIPGSLYLEYVLTIDKVHHIYYSFVNIPAFVLSLVFLATFWLSVQLTEKFALVGLIVVVSCVFLIFFVLKVPIMARQSPKIIQFYTYLICLLVSYFIIMICLYNISTRTSLHRRRIPRILRRLMESKFGSFFLPYTNFNADTPPSVVCSSTNEITFDLNIEKADSLDEWRNLAVLIDRLLFIVYSFVITILYFSLAFTL